MPLSIYGYEQGVERYVTVLELEKNICAWKDSVAGFFNQCAFVKLKGQKSKLGINIVH